MSQRIRSEFGTLGERIHATPHPPAADPEPATHDAPAPPEATTPTPLTGPPETLAPSLEALPDALNITADQVRWVTPAHVWIDHTHAGLLLGWARPGQGWLARVVWLAPDAGDLVVDWLPQDRVQPHR